MNWKYWVMTKMNPNNVRKPAVTARLPPENRRLANTVTSSMGWVLCRSQNPKAASVTADTAKPAAVWALLHPQVGAWMTVYTSAVTPIVDRISPPISTGGASGSRDVGTNNRPPTIAIAAIGTFTKKIEPHQKCS